MGSPSGFFASYILGHFLLALSEWLDPLATQVPCKRAEKTNDYCEEVCNRGELPEIVLRAEHEKLNGQTANHRKLKRLREQLAKHKKLKAVAYFTFHYIRINNPDAIADIERNAADYKLFRSLVVVFFLDFLISSLSYSPLLPESYDPVPLWRFVSILGLFLSWYRFYLAFNWTYRLGFEFYLQLYTPTVTFNPAALDFGGQQAGSCSDPKIVTLKNISSVSLTLTSVSLNGTNPRDFRLDSLSCEGSVLPPGCSCTVHIFFTPKEIGLRS
jgi:hypothetical protein